MSAEDGIAALSLVQELLTGLGLVCTSRLFEKEARLHHPMTREQLIGRLGLSSIPTDVPLILGLLPTSESVTLPAVDEAATQASPVDGPLLTNITKNLASKDLETLIPLSPHDEDSATPTRIPSFVGLGTTTTKTQSPAHVISPEQAFAPYPLPSDSGESIDSGASGAAHGPDPVGHGGPPPDFEQDNLQHMDMEEALPDIVEDQEMLCQDAGIQEHAVCEVPAKPAVLTPLPRNNLPPLAGIHSGAISAVARPAGTSGEGGVGPPLHLSRDAGLEGRQLLDLLGSQRDSEDDDLPGMHKLDADPDMFSDCGDVTGLELLLPNSSSESETEQQFDF